MTPKISPLEKVLKAGWVIERRLGENYVILSKNDEEILYNIPKDEILSIYKR